MADTRADHGIISAAIAEAAALPATSPKGQENISLLEQQSTKRTTPAKTQFTFTCESDSSKGMIWSGESSPLPGSNYQRTVPNTTAPSATVQNQRGFSTQGTQTSPTMAEQQNQSGPSSAPIQQVPQQQKKPRRPPGKRYAIAARERRMQQEYNNFHHPPREEDIWVCEFCEYESIFGRPPEALIRQYEIKDRRERKKIAEKRRLLEKAKMKGRKGKKGNKNAAKNNIAAAQPQPSNAQQTYNQVPADQVPMQNTGTQSDEYYPEDYEEEEPPPPLVPIASEMPTKIPQPIAQHYGQSPRVAHHSGGGRGG